MTEPAEGIYYRPALATEAEQLGAAWKLAGQDSQTKPTEFTVAVNATAKAHDQLAARDDVGTPTTEPDSPAQGAPKAYEALTQAFD